MIENDLLLFILIGASFVAGFVDAIAGGGGLITIPALLNLGVPSHIALGTNKLAASFGSCMSSFSFYKKKLFDPVFWRHNFYATFVGALGGTIVVNYLSADFLDKVLPFIILICAIYSIFLPSAGKLDTKNLPKQNKSFYKKSYIQGVILGFYDGMAGPGTGTFWTVSNISLYKLNILLATGLAKAMNFTSNIVSFATFFYYGQINWKIGLLMGVFITLGSFIGSQMAIKFGAKFIKPLFLIIVFALSIKLILTS